LAGTVTLLIAALCLAATTILLARLGRLNGAVPQWISTTAWVTAGTLCLGASVVLLVPFAAWAIAVAFAWSRQPSTGAA